MKKSYKNDEFSEQVCQGKNCKRRLKRRRVEDHNDTLCYKCNIVSKLNLGRWNWHPGKIKRAGLQVLNVKSAAK